MNPRTSRSRRRSRRRLRQCPELRDSRGRRVAAAKPFGQLPFLKFRANRLGQRAMTTEVPAAADAPQSARSIPLSLFAFAIFYGGMVCIAGVLGNKQVALGPLAVEAGIFAFLLLVVTSSAVAELHGRAVANQLVLIGFAPLIVSLLLS